MGRVLVACEESQAVTIELRKRGHEAYSCDILECSGGHPEWHLQQDVTALLKEHWDMIIAFPPCTYLTNAGARHLWKNHELNQERYEKGLEGKEFFTIYDFVNAYHHFSDPEWDGEPLPPDEEPSTKAECINVPYEVKPPKETDGEEDKGVERPKIAKIKLKDGKEREIQFMIATSFWSADGKPVSAEEFLNNLFGELPKLFSSEEELRAIWGNPTTRRILLEKLEDAGFGKAELSTLQTLINAENSDLFDVLEYVFNSDIKPISREDRVAASQSNIFAILNDKQKEFIEFVLSKYIETGVEELDQDKLPTLLINKYQSLEDAKAILGEVSSISSLFINFQKHLYNNLRA